MKSHYWILLAAVLVFTSQLSADEPKLKKTFETEYGYYSVALSPDGKTVSGVDVEGKIIQSWDIETGTLLATIKPQKKDEKMGTIAYSPDGKLLAVGGTFGPPEPEDKVVNPTFIKYWDLKSERWKSTFKPRKDIIYSNLEFSPDGKLLAWGSWDTGPSLWDSKSEKLRILDDEGLVKHIRFSPDGQIIAASGYALLVPGDIKLWDVKTGKLKSTLQGHSTAIDALAFGPDGKHLASSDIYGVIKIWEISKTGAREIASFKGHYKGDKWGAIRSLAYSPNGKYLVSGGDDKRIVIWDAKGKSANAKTREIIASLEGHSESVLSLVFSNDGKYLLSAGSDVKLWTMPE